MQEQTNTNKKKIIKKYLIFSCLTIFLACGLFGSLYLKIKGPDGPDGYSTIHFNNNEPISMTSLDFCDKSNSGKRVEMDGYLSIPNYIYEWNKVGELTLGFGSFQFISVYVPLGDTANHMTKLKTDAKSEDLKVKDENGDLITKGEKVTIIGIIDVDTHADNRNECVIFVDIIRKGTQP